MERSGNHAVDVSARQVTAMNSLMQQLDKSAEPVQTDLELGTGVDNTYKEIDWWQ